MTLAKGPWHPGSGLGCWMLAVLVAVPHLAGVAGGWLWDDDVLLHANPQVIQVSGLPAIWWGNSSPDYFPLTTTSFWIEYRLWGPWPPGYRAVNVVLHAANAVLVWRVLAALGVPCAWVAALVWGVHPVTVSSVDWIAERKNTLSMFFAGLSMLAWLRCHDRGRRRDLAMAWGWFVAALLAKTSFVTFPLLLPLVSWWRGVPPAALRRDVLRIIPFLAASLVLGTVTLVSQIGHAGGRAPPVTTLASESLARGMAVAGRAVCFSLAKDVWPTRLAMIYPSWEVDTGSSAAFLPTLAVLAVLASLWLCRRRTWVRATLFALSAYLLLLLPLLGFLPATYMTTYSFVADQWRYAALVAPVTLATALAGSLIRPPAVRAGAAAAAALLLAAATARHARVHADAESLWRHNIAVSDSWAGPVMLAFHLLERGQPGEALAEASRSSSRYGPRAATQIAIARAEVALGHPHEAQAAYLAAWRASRDDTVLSEAASTLASHGYFVVAEPLFARAVERLPTDVSVRVRYGWCLEEVDRITEAEAMYRSAVALAADDPEALAALAFLLASRRPGDAVEAVELARRASRLSGDADAGILDTLATALAASGDFAEAARVAGEALRVAREGQDGDLAAAIESHLRLFREGKPYVAR